jgi:hypothetical protein
MRIFVAIVAALLASGCAASQSHREALNEMKTYGKDMTVYCWGGGDPFECRDTEAAAAEAACLAVLESDSKQWSSIAECMSQEGWILLEDRVLHVNDG